MKKIIGLLIFALALNVGAVWLNAMTPPVFAQESPDPAPSPEPAPKPESE